MSNHISSSFSWPFYIIVYHPGSNWTLEYKKLEMLAYKWLMPIQKSQTLLNDEIARFELRNTPITKGRNELLSLLRPTLRRERDSVTVAKLFSAPSA